MTRHERVGDPISKRFARSLSDLKAYRSASLALLDRCTLNPKKPSIEVGEKSELPAVFETLIEATKACELDASLNRTTK